MTGSFFLDKCAMIKLGNYALYITKQVITMKYKSLLLSLVLILGLLTGCGAPESFSQIAATTLPVYEFTSRLCQGTGITVTRLVTESVSCLHDYSLNVKQVKAAEAAEVVLHRVTGQDDAVVASRIEPAQQNDEGRAAADDERITEYADSLHLALLHDDGCHIVTDDSCIYVCF